MERKKIKELKCFISDGNYSSKYPRSEEFVKEGIPFIRCNNFKNNTIDETDMYYITPQKHSVLLKGHVKEGDILITTRGSLGGTVIVPKKYEDANINAQIVLIRTNNIDIYNKFLMWNIKSNGVKKQIIKLKTGTALQQLPVKRLGEIEINIYPIEIQKNIAKELDKVQEIIDLRKKQIEELDELIKSQFVEMFVNIESNKWDKEKLKNVTLKITDGKHGGCNREENSGYYFVGATEIYNDRINYESANQITKFDFEKDYARCDLQLNDFVIVNTGATIGKSAIVKDEMCRNILLQKSVALIRTDNDKISPIFLKYCYEANPSLYSKGQGCARVNLLLSQIRETYIPIPPIELQNQFAEMVKQIDKQKFEIQKSLEETEELMESLMNKYFG